MNGKTSLQKPESPPARGRLTVLDIRDAQTAADHQEQVHRYAQSVWQAYANQHDLARLWIQAALEK